MHTKVTCIILAGGTSSRFGTPKQLAKIGSAPMLQRAIDAANSSKADYVILVLGASSEMIAARVTLGNAQLVYNKDYAEGLSKSIKTGISNIPDDSSGVLLMVADQPLVTSGILNVLIDKYHSSGKKIITFAYQNDPRNPTLIDREYFPEIEALKGDRGAKEIILKHMSKVQLINIENPKIFLDVDTRDNLENLNKEY